MNQNATTELRSLLEGDYFTYPKPIKFLFDIIKCNVRDNDIVLDFF